MGDLREEEAFDEDLSVCSIDGGDLEPCTVVMPAYGRGLKAPDLKQLKMPSDFYFDIKVVENRLQNIVQRRTNPPMTGKGRAQLIEEDRKKYAKLEPYVNRSGVGQTSGDVRRYSDACVDNTTSESDSYVTAVSPSRSCRSPCNKSPASVRNKDDTEFH